MSPETAEFVSTAGYGPFVFGALLLMAVFIRVRAGQEGATIALAGMTIVLGFAMALFRAYDFALLHGHLIPRGDGGGSSLRAYQFRSVSGESGGASALTPLYIPILLGLTYGVLLPGRWKILGPVGAGMWIVLWFDGTLRFVGGSTGGGAAAAFADGWFAEKLAAIRAFILGLIEWLRGGDA
ncbi:MAG: hypothetical protein AAF416_06800 [Pseudomonadota bacterium]